MLQAPRHRAAVGARIVALLEDLVTGQQRLIELLERQAVAPPGATGDPRHVRLLACIADALGDLDLGFDAGEIMSLAASNHALADVLDALDIEDADGLVTAFRSMKDRDLDGLRLFKVGRTRVGTTWGLRRTRCT